jgi:hypothetical protein
MGFSASDVVPFTQARANLSELALPRVRHAPAGRGRLGRPPHAIGEQRSFTNGRIIVAGGKVRRGKQKRADYLLYYRATIPLAVVEAKEIGLPAETGVQQAREYAEILGLKFAYATNGHRIIEIDYTTGTEREVDRYATPDELFARLTAATHLPQERAAHVLEPFNLISGKVPRYYQQIAINRVIEAILLGPEAHPRHAGHRHRQDLRRLPDLLEAVEQPLEPHRRIPPPEDPVPGRPQHPGRRPDGQDVRALRRCPAQDRRRRRQPEPGHVLRHLPGAEHRQRRRVPQYRPTSST